MMDRQPHNEQASSLRQDQFPRQMHSCARLESSQDTGNAPRLPSPGRLENQKRTATATSPTLAPVERVLYSGWSLVDGLDWSSKDQLAKLVETRHASKFVYVTCQRNLERSRRVLPRPRIHAREPSFLEQKPSP